MINPNDAGSGPRAPSPWESRRLWSLWGIMKAFTVVDFVFLGKWSTFATVFKRQHISPVEAAFAGLFGLDKSFWQVRHMRNLRGAIKQEDRKNFTGMYESVEQLCVDHELSASLATARKVLDLLRSPTSTYGELYEHAIEFTGRLEDEMKGRTFLSLSLAEAAHYGEPTKGWGEVIARFPQTVSDIVEARRCFALSRYTAAVFHSLQVAEIGIIELGRLIGVNDPHVGWGATTNRLRKILAMDYRQRTPFQREHGAFLEQMSATINVLQSAWRNKVSHAQGKLVVMTGDFTAEIAEEVLYALRGFMRRLATDAPTSPDPDVPAVASGVPLS